MKLIRATFSKPEAIALLTKEWREANESADTPSTGFCYIAAEAVYNLLGGESSGYVPMCATARHQGEKIWTHWWLENNKGKKVDPTFDQFDPVTLSQVYAIKGKGNIGSTTIVVQRRNFQCYPAKRPCKLIEIAIT